jgi:uncharacterized protein (TIGR02246 family)
MNDKKTHAAQSEIRLLIENWVESVRNLDIAGAVAYHADDMVMFDVPAPPTIRGIEAYRKTWPAFFDWLKNDGVFEIASMDVTAGDDVAFAMALLRCGTAKDIKENPEPQLRLTVGLRREKGKWIIAHEHHSFPLRE